VLLNERVGLGCEYLSTLCRRLRLRFSLISFNEPVSATRAEEDPRLLCALFEFRRFMEVKSNGSGDITEGGWNGIIGEPRDEDKEGGGTEG